MPALQAGKSMLAKPLAFFILLLAAPAWAEVALRSRGETYITIYETTGTTHALTFAVDSPQLTTRLADPLTNTNLDFFGANRFQR